MRRSSEQTKAVILAAAREQFAKSGFERATIRAIAADANIDPSMVMRYFGSKDQLFAAAADFDLAATRICRASITTSWVRRWSTASLNRWEHDEYSLVLLRSSATNAEAAQRMRGDVFKPTTARRREDQPRHSRNAAPR